MGTIALSLPVSGLPNTTEDPKVVNDLTLIQNVINGNLDPSNLSASSGIMRATYRSGASNLAANAGDWIVAAPSVTVTLPAPSANAMVAVTANGAVTGATAVTVAGTSIYGLGLAAASAFKLGAAVAPVILQSDGTNWIIVSGQQDTGWVPLTLATNVGVAAGAYTPSSRLQGDIGRLRGIMQNNTGGNIASNATWATIAAGSRPTVNLSFLTIAASSTSAAGAISTTGLISTINVAPAGSTYLLDGVTYSAS